MKSTSNSNTYEYDYFGFIKNKIQQLINLNYYFVNLVYLKIEETKVNFNPF